MTEHLYTGITMSVCFLGTVLVLPRPCFMEECMTTLLGQVVEEQGVWRHKGIQVIEPLAAQATLLSLCFLILGWVDGEHSLGLAGLISRLYHWLALGLWKSYLTSLTLCFFICWKKRINNLTYLTYYGRDWIILC